MSIVELSLIIGGIVVTTFAFIYAVLHKSTNVKENAKVVHTSPQISEVDEISNIFDEKFREELRNSGRQHFEKIIGENAMFLQQDLRLTTSDLNEYMKKEITNKLTEEFKHYQQAVDDAKVLAVEAIGKTRTAIEEQRHTMSDQLAKEIADEKARMVKLFQENMADVVNHYVLAAVGNQIDLNNQLEFILSELETNKEDIIADINNGA